MFVFQSIAPFQAWLNQTRQNGAQIGFAPTMGALHEGHLALLRMASDAGDIPVASIFVNPTQFNDPKDLEKYPRTPERDLVLLSEAGCAAVFMPSVEAVYPPGVDLRLDIHFGNLDTVMEGKFRPGHFAGMAMVVKRLLDIVQPQRLIMGQKDFQQWSIVRNMLQQLQIPVELVMCPTVREPDGLAMSSRNVRLTPDMRRAAPVIYQTLLDAKALFPNRPAIEIAALSLDKLRAAGLQPEYFDIVDGNTLAEAPNFNSASFVVACTAVFAGEVRLIDNLILKGA